MPFSLRRTKREDKLEFRLLGTLEVHENGERLDIGPFKQRSLLALLLINARSVVTTDQILDALWGEDAADRTDTLRVNVSRLRSALEPHREGRGESRYLLTRGNGYVLDVDPSNVDALRFESELVRARSVMESDPAAASQILLAALELWRGAPLEEFTYESFAQPEIERLAELRIQAVEERIEADLRTGRGPELVGELEALVREHPLRERLTGQLMLALYRDGRQAEALRTYQELRTRLGDELGIEPSRELQNLEDKLLLQDDSLLVATTRGAAPEPGLAIRGYELRELLREGPDGAVFRAFQASVGREVAVKVIPTALANDAGFIRRFESEALAAARLEHPNVVPIHDYWREPDAAYLVMGLIDGETLDRRLERGPIDRGQARQILTQIAGAVDAADRLGVNRPHLDTSNVILDSSGNAYLADFGMGIRHGDDHSQEFARITATLLGDSAEATELLARGARGGEVEIGANPYKGLRAFQETDANDFYGRERVVERLLTRVGAGNGTSRLTAVVGPSGSGKSSVVRAGLVPALRRGLVAGSDRWFITEMTPAAHPFEELETALLRIAVNPPPTLLEQLRADERGLRRAAARVLPDDSAQLLLVIDQFEELFSQVADEEERDRFLDGLRVAVTDPHTPLRVVLSLRADFLDRPMSYHDFGEVLRNGTELLPAMSPDELERAIAGPAESAGAALEPGLTAAIVGDVADQPGSLPLVQYAMTELFDRRQGPLMTLDAYRNIGGVTGALGQKAEEIYQRFDAPTREIAHQIFLRLITIGEGVEDTRRRVLRSELVGVAATKEDADRIIDEYGRHRLLTFDRDQLSRSPTVEVAHEALIREWPRFRRWVADARDDLREHRKLTAAAGEWLAAGEDPAYLLTGTRLVSTSTWADETRLTLTAHELEYITASRDAATAEVVAKKRRRRLLGSVAAVAALVTIVLVIFGFTQQAGRDRVEAVREVDRLNTAADDALAIDANLALLLAIEAAEAAEKRGLETFPETMQALHDGLNAHRVLFEVTAGDGFVPMALSADGTVLAVAEAINGVRLYEVDSGRELAHLQVGQQIASVALDPSASLLSAGSNVTGSVFLWDLERPPAGALEVSLEECRQVMGVEFVDHLDGLLTLCSNPRGRTTTSLLDVATGDVIWGPRDGPETEDLVGSLTLSPEGDLIALTDVDGIVWIIDSATGGIVEQLLLSGSTGGAGSTAFETASQTARSVEGGPQTAFEFEPVIELTVALGDGSLFSYDVETWQLVRTEPLERDRRQIAVSADGDTIATADQKGDVRVSFESSATTARLAAAPAVTIPRRSPELGGRRLVLSADGSILASEHEGVVSVYGLGPEHGTNVATFRLSSFAEGAVMAHDSQLVIGMDTSGSLRAWDLSTGNQVWREEIGGVFASDPLAIDPAGVTLATLSGSVGLLTMDAATGEVISQTGFDELLPDVLPEEANAVTYAPTGVIAVGGPGWVLLYDSDLSPIRIAASWLTEPDIANELQFIDGDARLGVMTAEGLQVWELGDNASIKTEFREEWNNTFAISPDTNLTVLHNGTDVGIVDLNAAYGQQTRALGVQGGEGYALEFSPDGSVFAAGFDGFVAVFDSETADVLYTLPGNQSSVEELSFSDDGRYLVTAGRDQTVRVYAMDPEILIDLARDRVTRDLTDEECLRYLGEDRCAR